MGSYKEQVPHEFLAKVEQLPSIVDKHSRTIALNCWSMPVGFIKSRKASELASADAYRMDGVGVRRSEINVGNCSTMSQDKNYWRFGKFLGDGSTGPDDGGFVGGLPSGNVPARCILLGI